MRFLLLALLSFPAYSQIYTGTGADGACTGVTIEAGGTLNCETLIVDASHTPVFAAATPALTIYVRGNVSISVPINLNGGPGANAVSPPAPGTDVPGGLGGPGAGDGGGFAFGDTPLPGTDGPPTAGDRGGSSALVCGGGGGGGGFVNQESDGTLCPLGGGVGGLSGSAYNSSNFPTGGAFRGGFGGGAGGDGPTVEIGTGGGGGGAMQIIAGGTVTITSNITAVGGNGGTNTNDGGGGGGGSGGIIWIQTESSIVHSGTMNANGGTGGSGGQGGNGASGSRGFIRLEDADGIVSGTFLSQADFIQLGSAVSSSSKLESGISCGMVKPKDDNNVFQLAFGFALVAMMAALLKTLSRFRVKL